VPKFFGTVVPVCDFSPQKGEISALIVSTASQGKWRGTIGARKQVLCLLWDVAGKKVEKSCERGWVARKSSFPDLANLDSTTRLLDHLHHARHKLLTSWRNMRVG
jgi:hypothetical protein